MSQQNNQNKTEILAQKLSAILGRTGFDKTPIDSVPLAHASSQNSAKKSGTRVVPTLTEKKNEITEAEQVFLDLISQGLTVGDACQRTGLSRTSVYRRRHAEYRFEKMWDQALDIAGDRLEEEADRRGVTGWDEAVYYKGTAVGVRRRYSDRMLMFRLRALKPTRYSKLRG